MASDLYHEIGRRIAEATGGQGPLRGHRDVAGGCINRATVLQIGEGRFFVKLNRAELADMFAAEADGLIEMRRADTVRVPEPICWGTRGGTAFLAMEHIEFGAGGRGSQQVLGRQLAAMHRSSRPSYGWHRDNTIGSTPQINTAMNDWVEFWRRHRLGYQLSLAARNGYGGALQRAGERLLDALGGLFASYRPAASLLHGDLWGGNQATDLEGAPVIYDPAVYFGDREADLAMTELFGGFSSAFYAAYREAWPLDDGYRVRRDLYNLYHVLNHLNLFGAGYRGQAEGMIERLLAQC